MSEEKQHKRRVHYSGKYPKKFEEKYKELNPENTGIQLSMSSAREIPLRACTYP